MSDVTIKELQEKLLQVDRNFQQAIADCDLSAAKAIDDLRVSFLGKKGQLTAASELMRSLDKADRPEAGKQLQQTRQTIESKIEALKLDAAQANLAQKLTEKNLDVTLPVAFSPGSLHPVTLMRRTLLTEFRNLGFTVYDGPEVELEDFNFSALNFKDDHPARDMQDTFFIDSLAKTVLRTHTSNIQIHGMKNATPPLRIVAPGRTYRCDSDLTHTPMFHQIEGLIVDQNISMADMKGVVDRFLKAVFGAEMQTRLRPSYFPFVEPGGEVDIRCSGCDGQGCRICSDTGWVEIGGLGMVHPNVFEAVDLDSERYTGFAFGFGIDRIAMMRYGLQDLRQLLMAIVIFSASFLPICRRCPGIGDQGLPKRGNRSVGLAT